MDGIQAEWIALADLGAAGFDDGVEAGGDFRGDFVKLVALIDFDGLARGVEDDFAVAALAKVGFNLSAGLGGKGFVDDVVENRQKFSAGHLINSVLLARPLAPVSA